MDEDELIAKTRARVARCRMLADSTTDLHAARILRDMADEGGADIVRLFSEGGGAAGPRLI